VDGLNTPLTDLRWQWNCRSRLVDFVTARRLRPSADRDVLIGWPARWRGAVALCLRSQDLGRILDHDRRLCATAFGGAARMVCAVTVDRFAAAVPGSRTDFF
jgi:hypothetical protein